MPNMVFGGGIEPVEGLGLRIGRALRRRCLLDCVLR